MLNESRVTASAINHSTPPVKDSFPASEAFISGMSSYKGQCNNTCLGSLDFKHVPSQLTPSQRSLRVGDVCVRLLTLVAMSEEYSSIVDLYNTYIAKGSSIIAKACLNSYTGVQELCIPAIPIHVLVSEWNRSLHQFHAAISSMRNASSHTASGSRSRIASNIVDLALQNVPVMSDHLWFVLHSIISHPCLVKHAIQVVGSVTSKSGLLYHTGQVDNTTVPGADRAHAIHLYLIAKSVSASVRPVTPLGDHCGATLCLIWVANEGELHDYMRNFENCHYVHIGTRSGN